MKLVSLIVLFAIIVVVESSSHSEAPGTAKSPQSDPTDLYTFVSYETGRENYVTLLGNFQPLQNPFGGPNYFAPSDDHFYEFYVDNDGDSVEDITFQFYFGNRLRGELRSDEDLPDEDDCDDVPEDPQMKHEGIRIAVDDTNETLIPLKTIGPITETDNSNLNFLEWYSLNVVYGDRDATQEPILNSTGGFQFEKPFDYAGEKTFPNGYDTYANAHIYDIDIPQCTANQGRVFVGQRAESFAVNLGGIFDLINFVPITVFDDVIPESDSHNVLRNMNVMTIALEVPISCLTNGDDVIGTWIGVRKLKHDGSAHVPAKQVARLGQPLVNEVFIGLRDKGKYNQGVPTEDGANFLHYVQYPSLPAIINALFLDTVNERLGASLDTIAPTNLPRNDLTTVFLTGIPGLNQPAGVAASEIMRLNTAIAPEPRDTQHHWGVIAGDNAGFPNGRRPGDDVVDVALMVAMGRICALNISLGCVPGDAPVGDVDLTDGAPLDATYFDDTFPYLKTPVRGFPIVPNFGPDGADCNPRPLPGSPVNDHVLFAIKKHWPGFADAAAHVCDIEGVRCFGNLNVRKINFNKGALNGILPTEFGLLTSMTSLKLNKAGLTGTLPTELAKLPNLSVLDVSGNDLEGHVSTLFGPNLHAMTNLRLNGNRFSGPVPTQFGAMTNLATLYINSNEFTGDIPSELGLTSLRKLKFQGNFMSPVIPPEITGLPLSFIQSQPQKST